MKKQFNKLSKGIKIEDLKLTKKNISLVDKFLKHLNGYVSEKRKHKYKYSLYRFGDLVNKDFDKLTKEEIREAGGIINTGDLSNKTKIDIIKEIKTAFKFWFGEDEYMPKVVSGLKPLKSKGRLELPSEMPDEKMIYKMIKACGNSRDKFFIALSGLDGALRPIEERGIKWGDIKKDKHSHFITINTAKKSGDKDTRTIRIIKSLPYFQKWSADYPTEKKDNNFVFINISNHEQINEGTINSLFRRLKKKLKVKGRLYPYLMRHALITKMSKNPDVSIPLLKQFVGHSLRSNTIAEYQHFGDDDVKDMQLQYNGIKKKEVKKEIETNPIICPKCKKSNEYDSEFCFDCNMALTQKRQVEGFLEKEKFESTLKNIQQELISIRETYGHLKVLPTIKNRSVNRVNTS